MSDFEVITEVEVQPPPDPAASRSFTGRDLGPYKRHGGAGYSYGISGGTNIIANIVSWVEDIYHKTAHERIDYYLGTDPTKYSLEVDGVGGAAIETASLAGSGIIAAPLGNVDDLKQAFLTAITYLHSVVPASFKRSTGFYQTSGRTASFFTVLVNGREVESIDWERVSTKSNIQIYSKARYASPIESIHRGTLLLGARNAAKRSLGNKIRASFTYRDPNKFGQIKAFSKGGQQYTPLAVPVLEMGLFGSNVTDYIGNIEYNLERGRKRSAPNMIERRPAILGENRWIDKRPRRSPIGRR